MKVILAAAVALLLAIPAAASAATVPVTSLTGVFAATNTSVTLTLDGVHFGVYPDASVTGGSLYYGGFNGQTLADISSLSYRAAYNTRDALDSRAVPYLRVFLEGDAHDVIFSPNTQPVLDVDENVMHLWDVTAGTVRYDDDAGAGLPPYNTVTGVPWSTVVADFGDQEVSGIYVSQGFSGGLEASALLAELTVNDTTFDFGAPVAGPPGNTGATGPTGVAGAAGTTTTVVVQQAASQVRLLGAQLRIIHVQRRTGEKFLSARAILRGKSLKVRGRAIQVDLRNKPAGNYNVHIVAKYRTKSGKVHIVRSTRNLSVTVA